MGSPSHDELETPDRKARYGSKTKLGCGETGAWRRASDTDSYGHLGVSSGVPVLWGSPGVWGGGGGGRAEPGRKRLLPVDGRGHK